MDQDATGTEVGLGRGDIVLDGDLAPPQKGTQQPPPAFRPTLLWHGRPSQQLLSSCYFYVLLCLASASVTAVRNAVNKQFVMLDSAAYTPPRTGGELKQLEGNKSRAERW